MKNIFFILSLVVLPCAFSNAVSSNKNSLREVHKLESSLQQARSLFTSGKTLADNTLMADKKFMGIHAVNNLGWYLTTQESLTRLQSFLSPRFIARHNNLNLILLYLRDCDVSCDFSKKTVLMNIGSFDKAHDLFLSLSVGNGMGAVLKLIEIEDDKDSDARCLEKRDGDEFVSIEAKINELSLKCLEDKLKQTKFKSDYQGLGICDNFDKLIGLVIPDGIDGKTSKVINITTPEIRNWISKEIKKHVIK